MSSRLLEFETRKFDSASLTGSYQNLGAVTTNPTISISMFNGSDVAVLISKDGTNDDWEIPAGGTQTFDSRDVHDNFGDMSKYILPKGAQLEIKQVSGAGTGNIIVNLMEIVL